MKITAVRTFKVTGTLEFPGEFWEERLIRPVDIYPEHKIEGPGWLEKIGEGAYRNSAHFVQIDTDDGVFGIGGPFPQNQAYVIETQLKPLLIGHDPIAIERIWDRMYRMQVHGRKGTEMMALSVIDCALWDLKGRYYNTPVYRLLGGPTRTSIPAYASALGYSLDPELIMERAQMMVKDGYKATKWFFRDGPTDGKAGIERNLRMVRTLREAVGPDIDIRNSRIPISGAEHEYTRWGQKMLMDAGACDVYQPDIYWCGGISETMKITALASAYDLTVIPHGHSTPATAHLIAAWPETTCPLLEYLIKWNEIHQHFLKHPLKPINGSVELPNLPGLGMDLDEDKIEKREEVKF